ncbi:ABC transporter permease [Chryseobacterium koreense]|uniref:ABC transporter permease n=1 Tax=Chryseobacterium koreense CCUG 49689 TaxID=1304281 RepID=A0A0J7LPF3_9FLAO|nr:ABC transporter permease [Chryseobacterium koreense]KMQ70950.1 ABC transporter permease [Chryseobacterium koreense CCUG 49689]MBB5332381.1 ABC-2 type transport system permease protein [Chryseobacterium koreense]
MKQIRYLLKREFYLFFTNKTLISVFFLAPVFYALLIGFTYKSGKVEHIPVIVVNHDNTPLSGQLVEMLQDSKSLKVLSYINEPANLKDEIIRTEAAAAIIIPERFEAMMLQKKYPEVNVYVNTSNVLTANFATKAIQLTLGTFSAGSEIKALEKKGMNADLAKTQFEPFKANYITLFNTTSNYLVFMWPAMMAVVLQQVILLAMAVTFSEEFKRESFIKDFAGKEKYAVFVMAIKCLPIWIFANFNILFFYLCSLYFRIPVPDNVWNFFLITAVFVVAATNLGVLVSILVPDALKATQYLMVIASPAFIISGFTWPTYAMPGFIKSFTAIIPLTPYLEALKIMVVQNGPAVLTKKYLVHLFILGGVYFVIGWIALKIKIHFLFKRYKISENIADDESAELISSGE